MVTLMRSPDSPNVVEFVAQFRMFSYVLSGLVAGLDPRGTSTGGILRLLGLWRTFVVSQFPQCCTMSRVGLVDQGAAALGFREMSGKGQEYDTEIVHQQLPEERMKYQQRRSHKGTASRYDKSRSGVAFDLGISYTGLCRTSYQY